MLAQEYLPRNLAKKPDVACMCLPRLGTTGPRTCLERHASKLRQQMTLQSQVQ